MIKSKKPSCLGTRRQANIYLKSWCYVVALFSLLKFLSFCSIFWGEAGPWGWSVTTPLGSTICNDWGEAFWPFGLWTSLFSLEPASQINILHSVACSSVGHFLISKKCNPYDECMVTCSVVCLSLTNGSKIKCGFSWNKHKPFLVETTPILNVSFL